MVPDVNLFLALPLGLLIGLIMGALGGGGAILAFPVFVYVLGLGVEQAQLGSLIVVGIGALAGVVTAWRHQTVRIAQGALFGTLGLLGNLVGTWLAHGISERLLMWSFAGLLVVVAAVMWHRLVAGHHSDAHARPLMEVLRSPQRLLLLLSTATATGLLTGFFGVGGGFMIVPALTLVLGFGISEAAATSLLVIAINCLFAFVPRVVVGGTTPWMLVGVLTLASVVGTMLGGWIGRKLASKYLQIGFICLLMAISVYTVAEAFVG